MDRHYREKRGPIHSESATKNRNLKEPKERSTGSVISSEQTRQILPRAEAHVRALYNKAAQAIASTDDHGKFIEVNPAFQHMFGYTRAEALKLTHLDITAAEYRPISNEKAQALFRREIESYRLEKIYIRKDGSRFWGDVSVAAVHTPGNRVQSAAIIVDISDRKKAEEALKRAHDELERRVTERTAELASANRELLKEIAERTKAQQALKRSQERFRAIFDTAKDCIFIKNQNLRYTLVNPSMELLLELPASEIMKRRDEELFGIEAANYLHQLDLRVLAGEIIEVEHTRPIKGISTTFLDIRAPMRNENGQIVGVCGISRNVTERTKTGLTKEIAIEDGPSTVMRLTLAEAHMAAKTDIIILLTGESGSGKDHLARYIHDNSYRSSGPFYAINCAAIPPELAESELFGHELGAFTGATRRKRGLLELAEGGTLLLNEIGELAPNLQAKLLTFLDTRSFTRVGGENLITVNARLIAATNRNLEQEVQINHFRLDLFYRLNVLSIKVPSLRTRIDDIPALTRQIISELEQELQLPNTPFITDRDMARLCAYKWPGNVRELRNVLERAVIVTEGSQLKFDFLECEISDSAVNSWTVFFPPQPSFAHVVTEMRRSLIQEALSRAKGSKQEASRLLGISRFVLRRQMKTLGMYVPKSHKIADQDGPN